MSAKVIEAVLKRIVPMEEERKKISEIARMIMGRIDGEGYKSVVVGSTARNTFIKGDRDIDIFVFFPKAMARKEFEKNGLALGKKVLSGYSPTVHYAEHPYTRGIVDGFKVEIVPCYKVEKKIISAVDRSPLHNEYLKSAMKESQKNEVRLLKQFLKGTRLYGADQKTHGFSGYLCELLVLYYGDFLSVIGAVSKWKLPIALGFDKHDYSRFQEQMILIDPVDPDRNVAAAVSQTNLERFVMKAREFLKKPSEDYFFPKKKEIDFRKEVKGKNLVMLVFDYPTTVVEEIVWSQLEKLAGTLKTQLELADFHVDKVKHWTDEKKKCTIVIELEEMEISEKKKHAGPPVSLAKNAEEFRKRNKEAWVEGDRMYAWKKREYTNAAKMLPDLLKKELVPSHLEKPVKKARILVNEKTVSEEEALQDYFG